MCSVEGCLLPHKCHGFCNMHDQRMRRSGTTDAPFAIPPPAERFWPKVDKRGPNGCWLWTGRLFSNGYGCFMLKGRSLLAHRVAFEWQGDIPEGLHLDHLCRVRACVNPAHLEPVTIQENNRRASAAKTHCPYGHPYNESNTYVWRGGRYCRTCRHARLGYERDFTSPDDNERLVGEWQRGRMP